MQNKLSKLLFLKLMKHKAPLLDPLAGPRQCVDSITLCCTTKLLWKLVLSLEINKSLKVCVHGLQLSCATDWISMHPAPHNQSLINAAQWLVGFNKYTSLIEVMTFICRSRDLNRQWKSSCFFKSILTDPHDFVDVPYHHCFFTLV